MKFIMDMVHDNPGEPRFVTKFRNPKTLIDFGFNTQVFRQNNTSVSFEKLGDTFFDSAGKEWLSNMQSISRKEIFDAHNSGLNTMCHIDLFVLPKLLVDKYKDEICDEDGRISIFKAKTKEIHRVMFNEMFERYPIDGLIIRVGETYLHDTPHHVGNGAVRYGNTDEEKKTFIELINFLREEICVRHNKILIFRTWDYYPDKFHSNKSYYLDVTNSIKPHDNLFFSIKYTALDFWRYVNMNPCLCEGKHKQIIEIQCQREYEGKGAYPMYNMEGIINGFPENKKGIKEIVKNPLISGIFAWSRGGGWNGPYIKNEFWCELNAYVICKYACDTKRTEKEIFISYCKDIMGLDTSNAEAFYKVCLKIPYAVLHGRYISAYDKSLNGIKMPSANWLRDDRIAGMHKALNEVFDYLEEKGLVEDALSEKECALKLWKEIKADFENIYIPNAELKSFIVNSAEYAVRFFSVINVAFKIFAKYRKKEDVSELIDKYDELWEEYKKIQEFPQSASLFHDDYLFEEKKRGLGDTISYCRKNLCRKEIIYKKVGEKKLELTFLPPEKAIYKSAPLYFIISGGGWHTESRQSMLDFSEESVSALRKHGFAVVSIDYRVTQDDTVNIYDILEDCFDALSYVCNNSQKLGIDPGNVILSGHSAGAHLALMLGYSEPERFSGNKKCYTVKGVAAMSAPTVLYDNHTHNLSKSVAALLRNCDYDKAAKDTSPIEYVTKDCPPTLLCAGTSDYLVFANSSEMLYKKLSENNAEADIILSVCGGHCYEKVHSNIEPSVKMTEIQSRIADFALKHTNKCSK